MDAPFKTAIGCGLVSGPFSSANNEWPAMSTRGRVVAIVERLLKCIRAVF